MEKAEKKMLQPDEGLGAALKFCWLSFDNTRFQIGWREINIGLPALVTSEREDHPSRLPGRIQARWTGCYDPCNWEWSLPLTARTADDSCQIYDAPSSWRCEAGTVIKDMAPYLWVMLGSALGGLLRFTLGRITLSWNSNLPWTTILINILGSFVIAYFGTLTLAGGRHQASENMRLFVMVGICGGFTTFSSFSLQTFDLARGGAVWRALANVVLSVILCLAAVALGHRLAQRGNQPVAVVETTEEEFTG